MAYPPRVFSVRVARIGLILKRVRKSEARVSGKDEQTGVRNDATPYCFCKCAEAIEAKGVAGESRCERCVNYLQPTDGKGVTEKYSKHGDPSLLRASKCA